jgi:dihydrofolate reductase
MNYVYVGASLDGYIAGPNDELDWLDEWSHPDDGDYGYGEFMEGIDALLLGRRSFDVVLGFGEWHYTVPAFVLSNTLTEVPEALSDRVQLCRGPLPDVLEQMAAQGFENVYLDGANVVQQALAAGLVDELIVTRLPIILGGGISLFGPLDSALRFDHVDTTVFKSGLVKSHYRARRNP